MLKILDSESREGKRALTEIAMSRSSLDFAALAEATPLVRNVLEDPDPPSALVASILEFDGVKLSKDSIVVNPQEGDVLAPDKNFVRAFHLAERRIRDYHKRQRPSGFRHRDALGVSFDERPVPHSAAGVYVPGGRAFYPSSLLMGVIPAQVAGVPRIVVATPPRAWEQSTELRWAARSLGIEEVLLAGGAHGIAGLVRPLGCTKIVGPGNRWVVAAKHLVSGLVSVDLPAGPSEVLIIATEGADAGDIAADVLAQAEHDPEAICLVLVCDAGLAAAVNSEVQDQLPALEKAATAVASLERNGRTFVFPSLSSALEVAKSFAPEHLQLMGTEAEKLRTELMPYAGAVFCGAATPTAFGDYLAGPNHVLPTGGTARSFSGLSTRDFYRWGRSVTIPQKAAASLGPAAATLARFEGLTGHAKALERRFRK